MGIVAVVLVMVSVVVAVFAVRSGVSVPRSRRKVVLGAGALMASLGSLAFVPTRCVVIQTYSGSSSCVSLGGLTNYVQGDGLLAFAISNGNGFWSAAALELSMVSIILLSVSVVLQYVAAKGAGR